MQVVEHRTPLARRPWSWLPRSNSQSLARFNALAATYGETEILAVVEGSVPDVALDDAWDAASWCARIHECLRVGGLSEAWRQATRTRRTEATR